MEEGTLRFGKNINDIESPPPLPEDWYTVEVREAPKVAPNRKKQENPDDEKAGDNWVVPLSVISDEEEYNGRWLTLFFPLPKPGDDSRRTPTGQTIEDACIERIGAFVEAFGGSIDDDTARLTAGARGQIYVEQQLVNGELRNSPNIFRGFKPAGADGIGAVTDDDIPF